MLKIPDNHMHELIRNSNEIEGIYDKKADVQSWFAWRIIRYQRTLTHQNILSLQEAITRNQPDLDKKHKGVYRDIDVFIGGKKAPSPALVKPMMENWLIDIRDPNIKPMDLHVRFEKVHPFVDGNGRTGRMLLWWLEFHRDIMPTFIPSVFKEEYYKLFK